MTPAGEILRHLEILRDLIAELRGHLRQDPESPSVRRLRHALALLEAAADALDDVAATQGACGQRPEALYGRPGARNTFAMNRWLAQIVRIPSR